MKSLSSVGLGLSVIFGCLFLALVAELYYLLWWKKRFTDRDVENDYSSPARELFYMFCWKRSSSLRHSALNPQDLSSSVRFTETMIHGPEAQFNLHPNNDFLLKPFGEDGIETEFMRLQTLSGPPRFLFTIIEETKEDLESEDGKSRIDKNGKESRSRSLSDLLLTVETPYMTPLASPTLFTPPLTPADSYKPHGFNPLFESVSDAEFNKLRSSPPPKFKFLQEAEEKLKRKLMEAAAEKGVHNTSESVEDTRTRASMQKLLKDEEEKSYITIVVDRSKEGELNHHHPCTQQYHHSSSSSQGFRHLAVRGLQKYH
ncbi:uncharacterized protein LOC111006347 isoform X2 [Momordica charantia]|uniref:Uncharacterized protein LOC111006347 isoform X2 n=1 Tax=Momordica charantia TaxID=3673 RepID=A0A6J1BWK9_MOMCH|nr:uncharacterized protein LOC111006347 isoform X2 [Momordica charantia]